MQTKTSQNGNTVNILAQTIDEFDFSKMHLP